MRELMIEIGPFTEAEASAGQPTNYGLIFKSDGTNQTLKIKAHIEKSIAGATNSAQVFIWNLNQKTVTSLNEPKKSISIYTKEGDEDYKLAFFGGITGVYSERFGADIRTRILAYAAFGSMYKEPASVSYEKDVPVEQIVKELASKIEGVDIDETAIKIEGNLGEGGFQSQGSVPSILDNLSRQFGFSWSIQDGVFSVIMDDAGEQTAIRLDSSSGLMKVSPRFSGITQVQVGVDIYSKYVGGIKPGQIVGIESTVVPEEYNRDDYKVHTLDCDLCPKENEWNMHIAFFYNEATRI